jgi:hypothetical protein
MVLRNVNNMCPHTSTSTDLYDVERDVECETPNIRAFLQFACLFFFFFEILTGNYHHHHSSNHNAKSIACLLFRSGNRSRLRIAGQFPFPAGPVICRLRREIYGIWRRSSSGRFLGISGPGKCGPTKPQASDRITPFPLPSLRQYGRNPNVKS